ncbi:hypothetical protein NLI96_g11282 [Meripilus lineatus]|uniref:T6SS Phospholipase effector Tle1-like catalytic domain-containing protein n=1 Tax=Meripilus lineatus TaxID=2056292 RepID=A0AAD5UUG3_9APHY|nr:hypothetical protein NLI96_g11282 [Physisporinus lineatus]
MFHNVLRPFRLTTPQTFDEGVNKGYKWLSRNYKQGDRIFLFGFSHGAYQAKTLAAMIAMVGLCWLESDECFRVAHEIYLESESNPERVQEFKAHVSINAKVHFLGLWDTVIPFGVGEKRPGTTRIHENVCYTRHALALDETRLESQPEYLCGHQSVPEEYLFGDRSGIPPVKEVWFAGKHSDIGGSLENKKLNKPAVWMEHQAMIAGLSLKPSEVDWTDEYFLRGVPRKDPGKWHTRLLELLPFTCPVYRAHEATTQSEGCESPQASAVAGIDVGHEETEWTPQNANGRFDMDTFDLTSAPTIIERCISEPKKTNWYHQLKVLVSIRGGISIILGLDAVASTLCKMIQDQAECAAEILSILVEHDMEHQLLLVPGLVESLNEAQPTNPGVALITQTNKSYMEIVKLLLRKYGELPLPEEYACRVSTANDQADTTRQFSHQPAIASLFFSRYIHLHNTDDWAKSKELLSSLPPSLLDTPEIQNCHATILEAEGTPAALGNAWRIRDALSQIDPETYDRMLVHTTLNFATLLTNVQSGKEHNFFPHITTRSRSNLLLEDREFAKCLMNLGNRFSDLDQTDSAIQVTKAAIALFRQINPESLASDADLATALNNLSDRLRDEGRLEDALHEIKESVQIRRTLSHHNARYQSDLATSLITLSGLQLMLGDFEGAHAFAQEAVDLHRANSDSHGDLASSLYTLSRAQHCSGQGEKALVTIQECVQIREVLAKGCPMRFIPDFPRALGILSMLLDDVDRYDEAFVVAQRAVLMWEILTEDQPTISMQTLPGPCYNYTCHFTARDSRPRATHHYNYDLAMVLTNSYVCLSDLFRHEEAFIAIQRAVSVYEILAHDRPAAFNPDLASSLHNLFICLSNLDRYEEALIAIQRAVSIYEVLAHGRPAAFNQDLASSLHSLFICLYNLDRYEEALSAIQRAVLMREVLAQDRPYVYHPVLATSFSNLGICLSRLGQYQEALIAIQHAVSLQESLAQDRPAAFNHSLARSLKKLSKAYYNLDRRAEALDAAKRSLFLYRELAKDRPFIFGKSVVEGLDQLSSCLYALGRDDEAAMVHEEARQLRAAPS